MQKFSADTFGSLAPRYTAFVGEQPAGGVPAPTSLGPLYPRFAAYGTAFKDYQTAADAAYAQYGLAGKDVVAKQFEQLSGDWNALRTDANALLAGSPGTTTRSGAGDDNAAFRSLAPAPNRGFSDGGLLKTVKGLIGPAIALGLSAFAPGLGTALGTGLGFTGTTAGLVGGGLIGAGTGALGGGLKGALTGGITGGLGGYLNAGGYTELKDAFGLNGLSSTTSLSPTGGYQLGDFAGGKDVLGIGSLSTDYAATASAAPTNALTGTLNAASGTGGGTMGSWLTKLKDDPLATLGGGAGKYALGTLLGSSPEGGYRAMQDAAGANAGLYRDADAAAQGYYQPYLQAGSSAQGMLANALGLNGQGGIDTATSTFRAQPGYQFARDQGVAARDASAARRGMLLSGNQLQALEEYGQGTADQQFDDYLTRLQQQAQTGYGAAGSLSQLGYTTADGVGAANTFAATAEALRKQQAAERRNGLLADALTAFFG